MRAVKAEVSSSNPISLAKATGILSRFASSETGATPDVAACLRRSAAAFNELLSVHREIRAQRRHYEDERKDEEINGDVNVNVNVKKKKKKKEREAGMKGLEVEDDLKSSFLMEKSRKENHLLQIMDGDRKKRKHLQTDEGESAEEVMQQEGKKKKKRRTIE